MHEAEVLRTPVRASDGFDLEANRVLSLRRVAEICGICQRTIRRQSLLGTGPKITKLSARRVGVRVKDLQAWMDRAAS